MVTIITASLAQGYSGNDHLITGRECEDVIGREFRSVGEARRAAEHAAMAECDRRVRIAPVHLTVLMADGSIREVTP